MKVCERNLLSYVMAKNHAFLRSFGVLSKAFFADISPIFDQKSDQKIRILLNFSLNF